MASKHPKSNPDDHQLEKLFWVMRHIKRLSYKYSKYLEKHCRVTTSQLLCLRALQREPGLSLGQLGRRIYNKPGTITGIIDRLEAKGLVKRERLSPDRRRINMTVTSAGQNVVRRAFRPIRRLMEPKLSNLSSDEKEAITQSLETLLLLMQNEKGSERGKGVFDGKEVRIFSPNNGSLPAGERIIEKLDNKNYLC